MAEALDVTKGVRTVHGALAKPLAREDVPVPGARGGGAPAAFEDGWERGAEAGGAQRPKLAEDGDPILTIARDERWSAELPDEELPPTQRSSNRRIPSTADLSALCKRLAQEPEFNWSDPENCFERAHHLASQLLDNKFYLFKIFALSNGSEPLVAAPKGRPVEWDFHVAVLTPARDPDGVVHYYVLDPAFSDDPMRPAQWAESFQAGAPSYEVADIAQFQPVSRTGRKEGIFRYPYS